MNHRVFGGVDFWRFSIRPGGGRGSMCGGIAIDDGCMLVHSPEACFLIPQGASQTLLCTVTAKKDNDETKHLFKENIRREDGDVYYKQYFVWRLKSMMDSPSSFTETRMR